jgi:WD40 repeat protein
VITFSPDGRTLVSGSQDGTIRCWDAATGQARRIILAHSGTVLSLAFSPDGGILATACDRDPAVRLWDVTSGQEQMSLRGASNPTVSAVFAPDGATLAAGDRWGNLTLCDLESRRPQSSWIAHRGATKALAFSADGRTLASAGDGTVKLWQVRH